MKGHKVKKKASPSKSKPVAVRPGRRPNEDKPTEVVNPLLIMTRKLEELTAENNNLKNQFNGLITQLDKKFSQEEEVKQAQLDQAREQQHAEPAQASDRSKGLLDKTLGNTSWGEMVLAVKDIANAWMAQTRLDQNANGMQSVNDVFSKVGQSVFQKFVSDKGLAVDTAEETVASNVTESTQYQ